MVGRIALVHAKYVPFGASTLIVFDQISRLHEARSVHAFFDQNNIRSLRLYHTFFWSSLKF